MICRLIQNCTPSPDLFSELKSQCWMEQKLPKIKIVATSAIFYLKEKICAFGSIPGRKKWPHLNASLWQFWAVEGQGLDLGVRKGINEAGKGMSKCGAK